MSSISIKINEQVETVSSSSNLADIISLLSLPELGCVFAINNVVVPRSEWNTTTVNEGDSISLFQAIAGG
ncbi:sulfur carrier protein ThiS [Vibrio sp. T187]|uniref:sulfur carrier protein ThiS n=1 Tax=Vibrio TaxID=662 RepID=UPI0010C9C19A|nr:MULTISPECIES: sulfur carrier protein ThiS [Vibrio]MBW3698598.1 sulfur carrier protein ThiS [Vibrio sp. T187]